MTAPGSHGVAANAEVIGTPARAARPLLAVARAVIAAARPLIAAARPAIAAARAVIAQDPGIAKDPDRYGAGTLKGLSQHLTF